MTTSMLRTPKVRGAQHPGFETILTEEALAFVTLLDGTFAGRRAELLQARRERSKRISAGEPVDFLGSTRSVRTGNWTVSPPPAALERRRVEITGPPTPTMSVNALNSGADVWMADFEDSTAPTWFNVIDGQLTLHRALRRELDFERNGKHYVVGDVMPTVAVRPRGWHLCEKHLTVDGRPLPASLVDFGLFVAHNAQFLAERGQGPFFYLPKLESHLEARLWNDVFTLTEDHFGLERGTIRATVLIETLPAAFEMDEILYELRDHSAGLNAGRWDYIFSTIRTFAQRGSDYDLPDRSQVTMTTPFLRAYTELLVATCHKRGAHAIGGMAAFVPSKSDPQATERALAAVRTDKRREAGDGFDGSWVAHPALVPAVAEVFQEALGDNPNQLSRQRPEVRAKAADLLGLDRTKGEATMAGLRLNVGIALEYLAAWVGGSGAVALHNLMEDAATVEISRAQVWQWIHNRTRLAEGITVNRALVQRILGEEFGRLTADADAGTLARFEAARDIFTETALEEYLPGFFTNYAYVKYLLDTPLRMTGPLDHHKDLRMSENVTS